MGQALDDEGQVLGDAHGATKKEVFNTLNERHPNAAEIRVMSQALMDTQRGIRPLLGVYEILDLIVAEFTSNPMSVHFFDLRIVERAKALVKEHQAAHAIAPAHTKNRPGRYDCYAKLKADEPYFVLRGKDPDAPALVEQWANRRAERDEVSNPKIEEARAIANEMRAWRRNDINTEVNRSPEEGERPSLRDA